LSATRRRLSSAAPAAATDCPTKSDLIKKSGLPERQLRALLKKGITKNLWKEKRGDKKELLYEVVDGPPEPLA
jgi:hypothetical protein